MAISRSRRLSNTLLALAVPVLVVFSVGCTSDGSDARGDTSPAQATPEGVSPDDADDADGGDGADDADGGDGADDADGGDGGGPTGAGQADAIGSELRYVALGDSIAIGTAAGTSYVEEYASELEHDTGAEVTTTLVAGDGWTVDDLLDELREDAGLGAELAAADVITVNIGGNDLLGGLRALVDPDCREQVDACLDDAVDDLGSAFEELVAELGVAITQTERIRMLDVARPAWLDNEHPVATGLGDRLDAANERLRDAAEGSGMHVIRADAAFRETAEGDDGPRGTLFAADGVHPSAAGHELLADLLAELDVELERR